MIVLCYREFVRAPSPMYFSTGALGQYFDADGKRQYDPPWQLTEEACYVHASDRMHSVRHIRLRRWLHLIAQATRDTGAVRWHCSPRDL
jgi:hypothetical protein